MGAGRFVCVALPILLTIGAIIPILIATLSGIAHNDFYLFSVNLENLSIDPATIENIVDNLDIAPARRQVQTDGITAGDLSLGDKYELSLWGYCEVKDNGERDCTPGEFDWATKRLRKDFLDDIAAKAGVKIELPTEVDTALKIFSGGIKFTEIAFIAALIALGVELFLGIFATCTRAMSCLTWLVAIIAIVLVGAACGLATAMAGIVVGAIEGSEDFYGVRAAVNTRYLVTIWIGAAFTIAASLFWLFTVCCCKPEKRGSKYRDSLSDGEKLLGQQPYKPLGENNNNNNYEMGGSYQPAVGTGYGPNQWGQYGDDVYHQPAASVNSFNRPPSHHAKAGGMAYEPYSHRA